MRRNNFKNNTKDMLFAEFLFYNKTQNLIDDKVVDNIRKKLIKENDTIFWTNEFYAEKNIGFQFTYKKTGYKLSIKDKSEKLDIYVSLHVMHEKLDVKKFNKAKSILKTYILNFEPSTEQQELINEIDFFDTGYYKKEKTPLKYIENWETLIIEFVKDDVLRGLERTSDFEKHKTRCELLFNYKAIQTEGKIEFEHANVYNKYDDLYFIDDVMEQRHNNINYRIAICLKMGRYGYDYIYRIYDENDKYYNLIDKNRIFFKKNENYYFIDLSLNELTSGKKILIYENMINVLAQNAHTILQNNEYIITPKIYNFFRERISKFEDTYNRYGKEELDEITLKYIELLGKNKTIKIQNVFINRNEIKFEDETFNIKFDENFMDVTQSVPKIKTLLKNLNAQYNLNEFYEGLLKISKLKILDRTNVTDMKYKTFNGANFEVNGIKIIIKKESNRLYINEEFCRIDDIFYMLARVICYTSQTDYKTYLEDVSHIGSEWLQMISQGVDIDLQNPFSGIFTTPDNLSNSKVRFSLLWDTEKRNNIYLVVNNKQYLIKYKQKFKTDFFNASNRKSLSELKNSLVQSIIGMDDDEIIEIVKNAIKEAQIVQQRGIELVNETVKEINAVETKLDINGYQLDGYLVIGRVSNSEYFIQKQSLKVFKKQSGNWNQRCVVDHAGKQRIYEDKLANRLVNIYNEPLKIHTIHN